MTHQCDVELHDATRVVILCDSDLRVSTLGTDAGLGTGCACAANQLYACDVHIETLIWLRQVILDEDNHE